MRHRQGKNRFAHLQPEENEAWIFSYADMMSLLLGFFIILYSFSQMSDQQLQSLTKEISKSFLGEDGKMMATESEVGMTSEQRQLRALEMLISLTEIAPDIGTAVERIEAADRLAKASDKAQKSIKDLKIASERLLVMSGKDKETLLELVLPSSVLFETASSRLKPQAKLELKKVASAILAIEDLVRVDITGHTDTRLEESRGQFPDHWALSASRAGSVASVLIGFGVNPLTLNVQGRAFYDPLFEEYTPFGEPIYENMLRNRRVHIKVFRKPISSLQSKEKSNGETKPSR